ncbi:MAG: hypothetical protein K2Y39_11705 [Candidatus Obscuribacterales bacterium]|nr:hypothetical protein [Candidatus Obscuribacterales bacterium]
MSDEKIFTVLAILTYAACDYDALVSMCDEWLEAHGQKVSKFESFVYEFLGTAYAKSKYFTRAKDAFSKSIAIKPSPRAYAARSKVNLELGKYEDSLADYAELVRRWSKFDDNDTLRSHLDVGTSMIGLGPWVETMSSEDSCFGNSSRKVQELVLKAEEFENSGAFDKATKAYADASNERGFDAAMNNAYALSLLASWTKESVEKGDAEICASDVEAKRNQVEKLFEKGLRLSPEDWRIRSNFGLYKFRGGDKTAGMKELREAAKAREMPSSQRMALSKVIQLDATMELLKKRYGDESK